MLHKNNSVLTRSRVHIDISTKRRYLTIIPQARMGSDSEAMRARGIIVVLVKTN